MKSVLLSRFQALGSTMKGIGLRKAKPDDHDFLYNLHKDALKPYIEETWGWDEEWQARYFSERFDTSSREIIQYDGQDVGSISVQDQGDALLIAYIAIFPAYQRQGIGSHLIRQVIQEGEKRNMLVRIQTLKVNPVFELYQRLGFRISGTTETHYLMEK